MDLLVNRATGQFMTGVAKPQGDTLEDDDWITFMPTGTTTWLRLVNEQWISYEGFTDAEIEKRILEFITRLGDEVPPSIIAADATYTHALPVEVKPPVDEVHVLSNATVDVLPEKVEHARRNDEDVELRKLAMQLAVKSLSRTPAEIINTAERYFKFLKGES